MLMNLNRRLFLIKQLLVILPTLLILNGPVWGGKEPQRIVNTPVINPDGGIFVRSVKVGISTTTPGAIIRYTLDGNDPTDTSSIYKGPFVLDSSKVVKSKAYKKGFQSSKLASAQFIINHPSVCGNGICEKDETFNSCPRDCKPIPTKGFFYGRVTEKVSDGSEAIRPIKGAKITAESAFILLEGSGTMPEPFHYETTTDEQGYYTLTVMTIRDITMYRVTVEKEGFTSQSKIQGIKGEEKVEINFSIEKFSPPVCGDGVCEPAEAGDICPLLPCRPESCIPCYSCPQDCHPDPVCGDGVCNLGETHDTCPADCKPIVNKGSFHGLVTEKILGGDREIILPITGVKITAEPAFVPTNNKSTILPPPYYETITSDDGYYKLAVDTSDTGILYRITAYKEGYTSESIIQSIKSNEVAEINFTLVKTSPPVCGNGICEPGEEGDRCPLCIMEPCDIPCYICLKDCFR